MHFFLSACPLLRAAKLPPEPINRSNGSFSVIELSLLAGNGTQSRRRNILCSEVILLHKEILRAYLTEAVLDADTFHRNRILCARQVGDGRAEAVPT